MVRIVKGLLYFHPHNNQFEVGISSPIVPAILLETKAQRSAFISYITKVVHPKNVEAGIKSSSCFSFLKLKKKKNGNILNLKTCVSHGQLEVYRINIYKSVT